VIVLRLGRRVGTFEIKTTTPEQIVSAITGAEFGQLLATNGTAEDNDSVGGK
jgi:D-xylose transport system ATP-binding protein